MAAATGQAMNAAALNDVRHGREPHAPMPRQEFQHQEHHLVDLEMFPIHKDVPALPAAMAQQPSSSQSPSQRFMQQQQPPVARSSTPHFLDVATTVRKFVHNQHDARKWYHQRAYKTPRETVDALVAAGLKKTLCPIDRLFMLAVLAGVFVAVGGTFALSMRFGLDPTASFTTQKLTLGICFSSGLLLIIMVGGELFTGNTMFLVVALLQRKISVWGVLYNWTVVYFGNFVGAVFGAFFLCWLPGIYAAEPFLSGVQNLALSKVSQNLGQLFVKAICANFMVCIGIFLATAAEDVTGKSLLQEGRQDPECGHIHCGEGRSHLGQSHSHATSS
jgi:formate/nitrite transporter